MVNRLPTVDEYLSLRESVGWRLPTEEDAARLLDNSLFGACVEVAQRTVAMARVVGDGTLNFYLQDLAVEPGSQGHGIGRVVVQKLEEEVAARGTGRAALRLIADHEVEPFYKQLGYERLPDEILGKRFNLDAEDP